MYKPKEWKDHIVKYLRRYRMLPGEEDGTVYLIPSPGEIEQQGTPQNAENFNHMETGIYENSKDIEELKTDKVNTSDFNEYMEEHFVPDYVSSVISAIGSQGVGWYRIAKAKDPYYNSCVITLKRSYNTPGPEYQRIQLINVYNKHKFVSLAALSYNHIWTKIRETWDADTLEAYLEVYLNDVSVVDGVSKNNNWLVTIEDALNATGNNIEWKAITPVKTEETVSGFSVIASLDLPANFDLSYLVNKNGDSVNGLIKFIQNGGMRFIPQDAAERANGIEFWNKNETERWGGIGVHVSNGVPDRIYLGAGTDAPWTPANGLSITGNSIKWKNSNVVTENDEISNTIIDSIISGTYVEE